MYTWLLKLCAEKFYGMKKPIINANCLVLETFPDYDACIYDVTKADLQRGFNEMKTLIKLVGYYKYNGYKAGIIRLS